MRFLAAPVSKSPTKRQLTKGGGRPGQAALSAIPEDAAASGTAPQSSNPLAAVVANRRLRAYKTPLDLIGIPPSASVLNAPRKPNKPQTAIEPDSRTPFNEWYEELTVKDRKALLAVMVTVREERAGSGSGASTRRNRNRTSLDDVFEWYVEQDGKTLLLQFKRWFRSLDRVEQDTALAYSVLIDPDFSWEGENRVVTRAKVAAVKEKSVACDNSSRHLNWAQEYMQGSPVVMPYMPEEVHREEVQEGPYYYEALGYTLSRPPPPGHQPKLAREGTLVVLEETGETVFEKIK